MMMGFENNSLVRMKQCRVSETQISLNTVNANERSQEKCSQRWLLNHPSSGEAVGQVQPVVRSSEAAVALKAGTCR